MAGSKRRKTTTGGEEESPGASPTPPVVRRTHTKIPKLYVGFRTELENHMPLTDAQIDDLFEPSDDPLLPTEQDYDRFAFSPNEYYALMGQITPESSISPSTSPQLENQGLPPGGTPAAATTGGRAVTQVVHGISTTARRILAGNETDPRHSLVQTAEEQAARDREVQATLKRKRIELYIIADTMNSNLYLRLKVYCKNRMFYRFEWTKSFKFSIIRDCFGIDIDHNLWTAAFQVVSNIRTSWQTKILNAAHRIIKQWLATPAGLRWAKEVFGKPQFIICPEDGDQLARIPPVTDFPAHYGNMDTIRKIFKCILDGTDLQALQKRNGSFTQAGKFISNKAKMCLQVEACNAIPWLVKIPASKDRHGRDKPARIAYSRPKDSDGSEVPQDRARIIFKHIKLMDQAATALVKCPVEAHLREQQAAKGKPVAKSVPHRMLGLLAPLPRSLNGGGSKASRHEAPTVVKVPNMFSTGEVNESDDDDTSDEDDDEPKFDSNGNLIVEEESEAEEERTGGRERGTSVSSTGTTGRD
ncbi:hypothetical protein BJ508DRAFT_321458 [Ascobolus immersus RN42]|uniref:Uncharacterized protein n=1 Tax=Ascobolus immersus RN42 TaxID=1160509 RepID=A0A3N4ILY4_ASCIM|nr:hypothetical protein BJ508DRAFT_321458 [Ascobolus immersus RN42]